ncbi:replication initiator protein A [Singulisphaera sp. PoT]|uniref:replication initiator protein A n=1 Tax=Singulisphaera sp. PoT TaxID=3411797 RepID=UPI003BF59ED0
MIVEPKPSVELLPSPARSGKDEMNFAEHPIALLTDRVPKGQTIIKFESEVYDERKKKIIPQKRVIEGSEEYGLPTATDDTVVLALIQLTKLKNDFTSRTVEFSRLELIKLLGWEDEGHNYKRIKLSLQRIAHVTYDYDNAWWDSRQKTWTTKIFHILDTVEINDSRALNGQGGLFPSRVVWNEVIFDSFQAGFLRNIDFQLCMRLEHAVALRMYRFLGKRFYLEPDLTFDLKEFALLHLNLGRNYEGGSQIARKLQPGILELEKVGFLEPMSDKERFTKQGRNWTVRFIQKSAPRPALQTTPEHPPAPSPLVAKLVSRGVGDKSAVELTERFAPEVIETKIEEFDFLSEKSDKKVSKNPAGYLVKSITDGYGVPKGFKTKAELAERQKQEAEAAREAAEKRRLKQEAENRERAEAKAITDYLDKLTVAQLAELDKAAITQADPETLKLIEPGPMRKYGLSGLRRQYVGQLLKGQAQAIDAAPCPVEALQDSETPFRLSN